jgi:hypothetical protein
LFLLSSATCAGQAKREQACFQNLVSARTSTTLMVTTLMVTTLKGRRRKPHQEAALVART